MSQLDNFLGGMQPTTEKLRELLIQKGYDPDDVEEIISNTGENESAMKKAFEEALAKPDIQREDE